MTKQTRQLTGIGVFLLLANAGAWLWARAQFGSDAALTGTAMLAYGLGLRHAVDADHIAAIDNVTRKLVRQDRKPSTVGLYFALGHSTVVVLTCGLIAVTASNLRLRLAAVGGVLGTGISACFLLAIALANVVTLASLWRSFRTRSQRRPAVQGGLLSRVLRPFVAMIDSPWQMYPLGFLFGLGFDTASEVSLLAVSAGAVRHALSPIAIMVFPALFAAAMALIDTIDGLLMQGAYGWALVDPRRKLAYNFAVTLFSIVLALTVGGLEMLNLMADRLALKGDFWRGIGMVNAEFGAVGCVVTLAIVAGWGLSFLMSRSKPVTALLKGSRVDA